MASEQSEVAEQPTAIFKVDQGVRAEVDLQVATAKAYPRNIARVVAEAISMATASEEIAESCGYTLERTDKEGKRKDIMGPSVRLAEIMIGCWGNLRCQAAQCDETDDYVVGRGTAWDMQKNVLVQTETRRSIRNKWGKRYSLDMVAQTANAAASIALRNAAFRVIPKSFVDEVYEAARKVAYGNAQSLAKRKARAMETLAGMGIAEPRVLARLGITDHREMTIAHLEILTGLKNKIKDGECLIEDEFPEPAQEPKTVEPSQASASSAQPADRNADLAARVRNGKPSAVGVKVTKPKPGDVPHDVTPPDDDIPPPGGDDGVIPGV